MTGRQVRQPRPPSLRFPPNGNVRPRCLSRQTQRDSLVTSTADRDVRSTSGRPVRPFR